MSYVLVVLGSLLSPTTRGQWVSNTPFPGGARLAATGFTLAGKAHVVGGLKLQGGNYVGFSDLWRYNEPDDTWTELDAYPGGNMYGGVVFVIDDIAYVGLGGNQNGTLSDELWAYDQVSGQWTSRADFPGNERLYAFCFTAGGKGYLGAGVRFVGGNAVYEEDVWSYDPIADTWTAVADYPGGGRVGCAAFSIADKGYVGLGDDGSYFHNDLYEYSPSQDSWTPKANVTGPNKSFASCLSVGDQGYLLGGEGASLVFTNSMRRYDQPTDTWSAAYNFTGTARRYGMFYLLGPTFYYGLGQTGASDANVTDDFWEFISDVGVGGSRGSNDRTLRLFPVPAKVGGTVTMIATEAGEFVLHDLLGKPVWILDLQPGTAQVVLPGSLCGAYAYRFTCNGSAVSTTGLIFLQHH